MSAHKVHLESFDDRTGSTPVVGTPRRSGEDQIEAARLAGYEAGYKGGWDDATGAVSGEQTALSEELARNLRNLGFTYFEARDELILRLRPFLEGLLDTFFPALLPASVAALIASELLDPAVEACDGSIRLAVSPNDADVVRSILQRSEDQRLEIAEEPALASGQARLTAEAREIRIDAERIAEILRDALLNASEPDPAEKTG